jgi:hypothetical protein
MTPRQTRSIRAAGTRAAALPSIRRESFAMAVLLLVQYGLGISVNLLVTMPRQDHGAGLGSTIANGPVVVTTHIVLGLALILTALAIAVRAATVRHAGIIAMAVVALVALVSAASGGIGFASTGQNRDSLVMALSWAAALLCYLSIMFITIRARANENV